MKYLNTIIFAAAAVLFAYLISENHKIKNELASLKIENLWQKQLIINRETSFLAKENHSYRIKARLERESGEVIVIPLFQTGTGFSGDDDGELFTLRLIQHLSEKNEKYFRLRKESSSGSGSWTPTWKQFNFEDEYNLGANEPDMILDLLFAPDVWSETTEIDHRWQDTGKEKTKATIIIEEMQGSHGDACMGPTL